MSVAVVENNVLSHELQLGEQLNECIHSERRSDFSLMLAMLADDVREQSQFILPKTEDLADNTVSNSFLRKQFHLPAEAPLSLSDMKQLSQYNQAEIIEKKQFEYLHLMDVLQPKPLAFRNDGSHIETNIINNTSIHCQLKHQLTHQVKDPKNHPLNHTDTKEQADDQSIDKTDALNEIVQESDVLNKRLKVNVQGWLDAIQTSLVKSALIDETLHA